ncbi:hypothetical protein EST38_g12910 [Candolleomyces aberdarensis]|uniref:Uncharacterized protein n=1 Tax=Candolleomyces aberdarensis TaxID=2316362 RepID=A0A4Q2D198_9AGAR|nr:hypothetical protein EST38_g12910 [Candolleomyces aberdarensis]
MRQIVYFGKADPVNRKLQCIIGFCTVNGKVDSLRFIKVLKHLLELNSVASGSL